MTTEARPTMTPLSSAERGGFAPLHAIVLLGMGFGAAGLVGGGLALWLSATRHLPLPALLAASVGAALLVGLATSALLLARVAQIDRALARLARGEPVPAPIGAWPLSQLLWRVSAVNERIAQGAERERQAAEYRDEVMRQVGEAAAREERNRLARELHDSIKQQLFSIGVSAAAARARAGESSATAALDDIERGAREAQVEMTALLQQLRPAPLENVGLVEALRDQCEALSYRTGAEVNVTIGALPADDRLPPRTQEQFFRMAQEALANIARHARAQHVWLRLEQDGDAMLLEIRDDGQGFETATARGGMGLSNLRERAGALGAVAQIESAPGHGATVRIRAPLVESLRQSPEELARQAALASTLRVGKNWLDWSLFALVIAVGLILFDLPFWSVALCLAACAGFGLLGRRAQREARLLGGRGGEADLDLGHRVRECLAWLFFVLSPCVWYLPVSAPHVWSSGIRLVVVEAGSALLLALGLLTWESWRRATGRFYRALAPAPRHIAIQRRRENTLSQAGTLVFIIIVGLIFGDWSPVFPPHTQTQWSDTASVALLALLVVFLVVESLLIWRWRRTLDVARDRRGNEALT